MIFLIDDAGASSRGRRSRAVGDGERDRDVVGAGGLVGRDIKIVVDVLFERAVSAAVRDSSEHKINGYRRTGRAERTAAAESCTAGFKGGVFQQRAGVRRIYLRIFRSHDVLRIGTCTGIFDSADHRSAGTGRRRDDIEILERNVVAAAVSESGRIDLELKVEARIGSQIAYCNDIRAVEGVCRIVLAVFLGCRAGCSK